MLNLFNTAFRFISEEDIRYVLGINQYHLEELVNLEILPDPYVIGEGIYRWRSDEVEKAIQLFPTLTEDFERYRMEMETSEQEETATPQDG